MINLFTIGFTGKSAEKFFNLLKKSNVNKIIDTRINNSSQLAGFSKGKDLAFFAKEICKADYEHRIEFAPTNDLLRSYRNKEIDWKTYEIKYIDLITQRGVENKISLSELDFSCLLCSENLPEMCHRRILAEYFKSYFEQIEIIHL